MSDPFYPSVDLDFLLQQVKSSDKFANGDIARIGSTTTIVTGGNRAIYKRSTLIRELAPGQICYEQASAIAIKFAFMGQLIEWLENKRSWKEGAYIVPQSLQIKLP